jgi:hypothetical protein
MHVKTDVFCSAGLTLPDKAGRQINIGGWANDATYGIRCIGQVDRQALLDLITGKRMSMSLHCKMAAGIQVQLLW